MLPKVADTSRFAHRHLDSGGRQKAREKLSDRGPHVVETLPLVVLGLNAYVHPSPA